MLFLLGGIALKGTENKGTIKVRTRREGPNVVISISDTGPGIRPEIAQRIFEPFFATKEVSITVEGRRLIITPPFKDPVDELRSRLTERHDGNVADAMVAAATTKARAEHPASSTRPDRPLVQGFGATTG